MKPYYSARSLFATLALATALGAPPGPAGAAQTDLSTVPLGTASSTSVLPNLMFILDDSGSMRRPWMPDNADADNTCKAYRRLSTPASSGTDTSNCIVPDDTDLISTSEDTARNIPSDNWLGGPPVFASQFNTMYYNPQITYSPGKDGAGATLPSFGSPWTAVKVNAYVSTNTINLTTQWPEPVFCKNPTDSATDNSNCRRNGYKTDGTTLLNSPAPPAGSSAPFRYSNASTPGDGTFGWPEGSSSSSFRFIRMRFGTPFFFVIQPREHCSDINLTSCVLSTVPSGANTLPAPVRYCQTSLIANNNSVQSGSVSGSARCQAKYDSSHQFVRYGNFVRTNIVSTVATYGSRPNRTDCAAKPNCTYAEEMTNFANWFAYYHTRMQTMKTASGRVFSTMDDRYRIGFVTINASDSARYLKIDKFEPVHKGNWYTKFYGISPSGRTPLREALSRVGRHYGGMTDGINSFMPDDPVQYSCQQNFALLTTDGYWNGNAGVKLNGTSAIGDQDDVADTVDPIYVSRSSGTLDGMNTVVTTVTRFTEVAQQVCTVNNNTTFSTAIGGTNQACGCTSGNKRIKQRTHVWDQTVVTNDGVTTSNTTVNVSNTFVNVAGTPPSGTAGGACVSTGTTLTAAGTSTTTGTPAVTTVVGGFGDTLADVAMYYYKTDLRTTGSILITKNNVPASPPQKPATHQNMMTFTLGLGLDGLMNFRSDYETASTGDFKLIKDGSTGCTWTAGTCNWPQPAADTATALDDLWHAAVNGRGLYFSAKDPNALQSGLTSALAAIKVTTGSAASSATSTPNVTPTDNFIYSSNYRTVKWDGEVIAEKIDVVTGSVLPGIAWAVGPKLDAKVTPTTDSRTIFTFDPSDATDKLKPFLYANLSGTQQAFFNNQCTLNPTLWPQCGAMIAADLAIANSGTNLVNFLRGQKQHETSYYRVREHTLGDTVNAKPAFLGKPTLLYGDAVVPDYNTFKSGPAASRTPALFIAANDGMLHAFHGGENAVGGGSELWAYVPRMLLPQLFKLAANNYDVNHRFYVDGSPTTMDVFIGGAWKTILVGGLNAGGRGYYALDVTDTSNPKGLWEVCADPTGTLACTDKDDNIGYSYGQPIITKDPKDGKWVVIVSSGYNNVSPGDGKGYIYIIDAETGAILDKKDTGVGDTTTPSGFAKISGFATNFAVDNTTTIVYGGDLLGNVFSFDVENRVFQIIGQAKDSAGKPQSITTKPDVTRFDAGFNVVYVATGRFLGASDIQDPATLLPPLNVAYQQSVYGLKDTGADLGDLRAPGAKLVQQIMSLIDATSRTISNNAVDWTTRNGWWVDLNPANDSPGERVNIDIQLVRGVLLVDSNEPNNEACSSGGNSFFYQFDYQSGSYLASSPGQVVGVKLGAALAAGFVVYRLPSGQLKYTGIDVTGQKQTGGVLPGSSGSLGRRATWRELYQ